MGTALPKIPYHYLPMQNLVQLHPACEWWTKAFTMMPRSAMRLNPGHRTTRMYIKNPSKHNIMVTDFNWCTTEILTRYIFDSDELHGTKRCDLIRFSTRNSVEARFFIGNFGTNDFPISTHNGISRDTFISYKRNRFHSLVSLFQTMKAGILLAEIQSTSHKTSH